MDVEVILRTHVDAQLPLMYAFDATFTWLTSDIANIFIHSGNDQTIVIETITKAWYYILTQKELWKSLDFVEFPEYEVSTFGNIKTVKTGYVTKGSKIPSGYLKAILSTPNRNDKGILTHRLVAIAFLTKSENKQTVDHLVEPVPG